jgi:prepilin-type N-terminal cleavage/methylation domain-containing protein
VLVPRLREQRGFTVVELLAVMLVGGIVLAGVASLMQVVMRQSTGIVSRTDASQRGRLVMDRMTRQLRSQVCLDLGYASARPALEAADRNSITFFVDLSDGTKPPLKRQLAYDATNRRIVEREYERTSGVGVVPTSFRDTPYRETVLLDNVTSPGGTGDFFSFRRYTTSSADPNATDTVPVSGATPLSPTDLALVARITISMDVRPANARDDRVFTRLQDSVLIRNLNTNPDYSPTNPEKLLCA